MNLYFVGGEDIDFNAGATAPAAVTTAGTFRSAWTRCCVRCGTTGLVSISNPFLGGAVTSCWFSVYAAVNVGLAASQKWFGLILGSTGNKGIYIGSGSTNTRIALFKYDGTTLTQLAQSSTDLIAVGAQLYRFDVQLTSFGASATVNIFLNGVSVVTFTGDVTVSGVSNVDSAVICSHSTNPTGFGISEFIVADSDTRAIQGVQTLALTGAGTTNGWTNNTFSNINGVSFSDTSPTSVNTTGTNQQYNVTDPSPSVFSVVGVKISARLAKSATPTPTQVRLGYNSGGSVAFGTGATKAVTASYATFEQIDQLNPITSAVFTSSELTALQLNLQSA